MLNAAVVIVWSSACESYVDMASFGLRHKCVSGKCHLHGLSCMLCVSHDKHLSTHFTTSCDVTTSITVMSMNQTFSQKLIVPKPLPPMTTKSSFHFSLFFLSNRSGTMDAESLQAMFVKLYIAQRFAHQLQAAEETIIEVCDFLDEQGIQHQTIFDNIRSQIRQMQVQVNYVISMELLAVCRRLERHLRQFGRLPLLNLDFR